MAAPKETIWELEPHTRAKHEILKRYLQAWMIILSQGQFPEILYIDGFAGPGEYSGGEKGSPLIALDTALAYNPPLKARINFLFIEKNRNRAQYLQDQIKKREKRENFRVIVEAETFEVAFEHWQNKFQRNGRLMPTFAFIDPFGWSGVPFKIVERILSQPNCEVFVNFMYEEINRFLSHPDQDANFTKFFGTDEWGQCVVEAEPRARNRCLHDLYLKQLKRAAKTEFARSFEMSNSKDVTDYFLFYATKQLLGLKKMKEAMWKVDGSGEFRFSDATDPNQFVLFENGPVFQVLKSSILNKFRNKDVKISDIEYFVLSQTAFRETHYKKILKSMETETGDLKIVSALPGRKVGTFGDQNMLVRIG